MPRAIPNVLVLIFVCLIVPVASATIFGSAHGIVHDAQHRPIAGAIVVLKAEQSDFSRSTVSNTNGEFSFAAVPLGRYVVTVAAQTFSPVTETVLITSGAAPVLHLQLSPQASVETVTVNEHTDPALAASEKPLTVVTRQQIEQTPGASRSNSLAMITSFVPGASITHDQLHVRGGHQVSWLIDGVPVPNTNISSNLGPQFDPKDIDYLEVDRGSYGAELGDRTYGVFNIVPRTGFERNNEAELLLSAGNFHQTNDQFNLGSHTERLAYYASVNGNRSDLGIQTPVSRVVHDTSYGFGAFGTIIFNADSANQFRFVTSLRRDSYQIPYDPFPNDIENDPATGQYPTIGLRDSDRESDILLNFSWVHTFSANDFLTVSPFFHRNAASYSSRLADTPVATAQDRTSNYAGGQISLQAKLPRNNLQLGAFSFYQNDRQFLGAAFNNGTNTPPFADREHLSGSLLAFFIDDRFQLTPWLTITAGLRPTRFSGAVEESAVSPRFSAALHIPHVNWTLRAFYGHYYQAPPLITASGPLLALANSSALSFVPLHGERDEEHQFGIAIPYRGWTLDVNTFRTRAVNYFDHNNIGESNLFFPLTIQAALIRGWEVTVQSPRIARRAQFHLAYSNQIAEAGGVVTGGLTDLALPPPVWPFPLEPLDNDQRHTLSLGGNIALPWRVQVSTNVAYGSGFTNSFPGKPYPGAYLPSHTIIDLGLTRQITERCTLSLNALNIANRRVELDNSVTFGGFHWTSPREISAEVRYRFHY